MCHAWALAKGFGLGYAVVWLEFNDRHDLYLPVLLAAAIGCGMLNAARSLFLSEKAKNAQVRIFRRVGLPLAVSIFFVTGGPFASLGLLAGAALSLILLAFQGRKPCKGGFAPAA